MDIANELLYINLGDIEDADGFPTECYVKVSKFELFIYRLGITITMLQ